MNTPNDGHAHEWAEDDTRDDEFRVFCLKCGEPQGKDQE